MFFYEYFVLLYVCLLMFMKNFFKNIDFRQIIPCAKDCFLVKSM